MSSTELVNPDAGIVTQLYCRAPVPPVAVISTAPSCQFTHSASVMLSTTIEIGEGAAKVISPEVKQPLLSVIVNVTVPSQSPVSVALVLVLLRVTSVLLLILTIKLRKPLMIMV